MELAEGNKLRSFKRDWSIWDVEKAEEIPFFGNAQQLDELTELTEYCIKRLRESTSAREIVLETWLTVDFAMRQFLISGFELFRFCDDDFDLRYMLLPNSFRELLKLFKDTKEYYKNYPSEPDKDFVDKVGGFRSSCQFWDYIIRNHQEFYKRLVEISDEYRCKMNPEISEDLSRKTIIFGDSLVRPEGPPERLSSGWRKVADRLDVNWIKLAENLNNARNAAAHSPDIEKIGSRFGLKGENIIELIRDRCRTILKTLLGVSIDE